MENQKIEGWKNFDTWLVMIYLNNDRELYEKYIAYLRLRKNPKRGPGNGSNVMPELAAKNFVMYETGVKSIAKKSGDDIHFANVSWKEIAEEMELDMRELIINSDFD